jgi:hypothetical protein
MLYNHVNFYVYLFFFLRFYLLYRQDSHFSLLWNKKFWRIDSAIVSIVYIYLYEHILQLILSTISFPSLLFLYYYHYNLLLFYAVFFPLLMSVFMWVFYKNSCLALFLAFCFACSDKRNHNKRTYLGISRCWSRENFSILFLA